MGGFLFFDTYIKSFPSYFGRSFSISNRKFFFRDKKSRDQQGLDKFWVLLLSQSEH